VRLFCCLIATISLGGACHAGTSLAGCEARPEVRQAFREKLNYDDLQRLKFAARAARQHEVLEDLIAKYPEEVETHIRLTEFVRDSEEDQFPALRERYRRQAMDHPEDPRALYIAAVALLDTETPESIRLLEAAQVKAPDFAWPSLRLANVYSSGKRVDKKKSAEYLAAFLSRCPSSTESTTQWLLNKVGDKALQTRFAAALRERLANETDPVTLLEYETLWGVEFRTHPPQQHAGLREQIKTDLKRLESLGVKRDGDWMALLRTGYKQSASEAEVTALEDRIVRELPASQTAYSIRNDRWKKTHKEPADNQDAAAWATYNAAHKEALKGWIRDCTDAVWLSRSSWFYEIYDDNAIPEKEGIAALDHFLKASADYDVPSSQPYLSAAAFLVKHKWQPVRALDLLHKAQVLLASELNRDLHDDNVSNENAEDRANRSLHQQQNVAGLILQAAGIAGRPAEAQALRASVDGPPPSIKKRESDYWLNRARLAVLEDRKADGLTYYQIALQTRVMPPNPSRGKLQDSLSDEARALWKEMRGTEVAYAVWSKPPTAKAEELKEGRWEKSKKALPAFEMADLSGQTWKLSTLEGKSVLINLWATWCGPCNQELPHLQELYTKVKDRPDVQILTLNIDEDLGLVQPFMKEKGYTFPVLPAYSFVIDLLDGFAIPQNWIVDPQGKWRWTQIGFGAEPDWVGDMIQRLESAKKSEAAVASSPQ
jgi:thiol-disulfide isomerase/thioredoxin